MGEELKIIITAADQASDVLRGVGKSAGGLDNILGTVVKTGALAAAAGIAAFTTGVVASVRAAMEAEGVDAQLNAVLKSTKGAAGLAFPELDRMANSLAAITPYEDDVIKSAESMLLTFTNIKRDVFPQATETALDMAQALGMDATQASMMLGKALNDPTQGVTALRRVGVQLSDAQEEQVKKFMAVNNVAAAQKVILGELATEFGGSAKAAGQTFGGQLTILQNQFGNILETVGGAFLPTLKELTGYITKQVMPAFQKWAEENAGRIQESLKWLGNWISGQLIPAIQQLVGWVVSNWPLVQKAIVDAWAKDIQPALQAFGNVVTKTLWPALQQLWTEVQRNWPLVQKAIVDAWDKYIQPALQALADFTTRSLWPALQQLWTGMQSLWTEIQKDWPLIQKAIGDAWAAIQPILQQLGNWLGQVFGAAQQGSSTWSTSTWPQIQKALNDAWSVIQPILQTIFDTLAKFWKEIQPKLAAAWSAVSTKTQEVMTFIQQFIKDHWDQIQAIFKGAWDIITGLIEVAWGVISGIVKIALDLISGNFQAAGDDLREMATLIWDGITKIFGTAWEAIKALIGLALDAIWKAVNGKFNEVTGTIRNILQGVIDYITAIPQQMWQAGVDLIQGLINGFNAKKDEVLASITGIGQSIINAMHTVLDSHSPSRVFAEIGQDMAAGLIQGFSVPQLDLGTAILRQTVLTPATVPVAAGGGVAAVQVYVNYQPMFSMADARELKQRMQPLFEEAYREAVRKGIAR